MIRKRLRTAIIVLLTIASATVASPAMAGLSLKLSLPQKQYLVGEPVFAVVSVSNTGKSSASIIDCLNLGADFLKINIAHPSGESLRYQPMFAIEPGDLTKLIKKLAPGKSLTKVIDMTYGGGAGAVAFSEPGNYVLRASYTLRDNLPCGPMALAAEPVKITAVQPSGKDVDAYQVLLATGRAFWSADPSQAKHYREILSKYPNSRYALHARFYLAMIRELEGCMNYRGTAEARPALLEAASLYAEVGKQVGNTPLGLLALRLSGRCQAKLGNSEDALKLLNAVCHSPAASDSDKEEGLAWMQHVKSGLFYKESGLGSAKIESGVTATDLGLFSALFSPLMPRAARGTTVLLQETDSQGVARQLNGDGLNRMVDYVIRSVKEPTLQKDQVLALLTELRARNAKFVLIPRFGPDSRVIVMSKAELNASPSKGGYKWLRSKFTDFNGLATISLPAYSEDGKLALVLSSRSMASLAGSGWLDCYEKRDGEWKSVWSVIVWKS